MKALTTEEKKSLFDASKDKEWNTLANLSCI